MRLINHLLSIGKTEEEVNEKYDTLIAEATNHFKERIAETLEEALPAFTEEVVRTVETKKKEHQKETIEEAVRNHLRGFSRTIPSFLRRELFCNETQAFFGLPTLFSRFLTHNV